MGKSPGKWIKSVLFRKKTSNSSLPKRQDIPKSSYEKASSAPLQTPVSNVVVQPCFISEPVLVTRAAVPSAPLQEPVSNVVVQPCFISEPIMVTHAEVYENNEEKPGRVEITEAPNAEPTSSSPKEDGDGSATLNHVAPDESENRELEQAATKVQATFRGYRARRAFRTLKGIIRLQAVIRGHLVRRQAVATLNCVLGIVKFQALVRGRLVRRSDLGSQIHAKQTLFKQNARFADPIAANTCDRSDKLKKTAFTRQLLSSTSSAKPLHHSYDPKEPNSAWNWLLRWTMSHIWGTLWERETVIESKSKVELQRPVSKLNRPRKKLVNLDKTSARSTSDSGKIKGNSKANAIDKSEYNPKNVSYSSSEIPDKAEVDTKKQRRSLRKPSNSPVPEVGEKKHKNQPIKATKVLQGVVTDPDSQEKCMMQPVGEGQVNSSGDRLISESLDKQLINEARDSKEDLLGTENHNHSKRRASLPAKHDDQETLQHGAKVPSYMAATKSAKAKVRGQASRRFGEEEVENNVPARRYSLPSSVNAKPTSSPRVQRLVQSSGKRGIRIDRSMSSSRDSNEKMVQPEWKR